VVPGQVIFKLYDTYGFPVDIIRDVTRDEEFVLDMEGFDQAMAGQRAKSRSVAAFTQINDAYKNLTAQGVAVDFIGRDQLSIQAKVLLVVKDNAEVDQAGAGSAVEVVTDMTPFYAEAGGQVGDAGKISAADLEIEVTDTVKDPTGLVIHKGQVLAGQIEKGQSVHLSVDADRRAAIQRNHTATHILHSVLREVLGDHVKQAGSLVAPDRLRFDFSHFAQIEPDTLQTIETLVNQRIRENVSTHTEEMESEKAFQSGAMALFEEKYGDVVRVVSLSDFSKELCGGIHAERTGDIGLFVIVSESSVASGVRRIEALTGAAAVDYVLSRRQLLDRSAQLLKDRPEAVPEKIERLLNDHKQFEKEIQKLKLQMASLSAAGTGDQIRTINGVAVLAKKVAVDSPAALRDLADRLKDKLKSGIVVLGSTSGEKALLIAMVTSDLTDRFHAGNIVKAISAVVGGGGGGRPDMAQAGGTRPEKLDQALEKALEVIEGG
jgi:alanyl-tRNA synthetase